ncbi:MAG: hypothetical protein V9G09_09745 [Candidatus Nanopelagicales bacterium]
MTPPSANTDEIPLPGAHRSTHRPLFEPDQGRSFCVLAPTVMTDARCAGDLVQASAPWLPAAAITGMPLPTNRRTARSTRALREKANDMFTTAGRSALRRIQEVARITARRSCLSVIVDPPSEHPNACTSTNFA